MQSSLPAPAGAKQGKPLAWVDPPGLPDGGTVESEPDMADCTVLEQTVTAYPIAPHGTMFVITTLCFAYDQLPPGGDK